MRNKKKKKIKTLTGIHGKKKKVKKEKFFNEIKNFVIKKWKEYFF